MEQRRQFSLGFLLLEVALIGIALGLFRAAFQGSDPSDPHALFFAGGLLACGAAIGGVFGRMIGGLFGTFVAIVALAMFIYFLG